MCSCLSASSTIFVAQARWKTTKRSKNHFGRGATLTYRELSHKKRRGENLIRMSSRNRFWQISPFERNIFIVFFTLCAFVVAQKSSLFQRSDDNWGVWLMCEFCVAPVEPPPELSFLSNSLFFLRQFESSQVGSIDRELYRLKRWKWYST